MTFKQIAQQILTEKGKRIKRDLQFVEDIYIRETFYRFCEQNMGLCLVGKVGGGKTFFFEVLNRFLEHKGKPQFIWHEADDLELILRNEGKDALIKLAKRPESILINDLGMEKKTKEGSNGYIISNIEQEPFEIFMYYRHKMWIKDPQTKTHITSNLTSEEFRTRYGDRTMSRMFECIDFIVYKNDQTDYRK